MNYIHPTAVIGPNVELGENNYIGPGCIIGYPAEHKHFWQKDECEATGITTGKVKIGDNNVFTGNVCIDAGTTRITTVYDNCYFMKGVYLAHDCIVMSEVTLSAGVSIGGHCFIENGVNIGMNASVHQRCKVPHHCMIGMNSCITKVTEMLPQKKYVGVPARYLKDNIL